MVHHTYKIDKNLDRDKVSLVSFFLWQGIRFRLGVNVKLEHVIDSKNVPSEIRSKWTKANERR